MNNLITFTSDEHTDNYLGQNTLKHIATVSGTQQPINKYLKNEGKCFNDLVTLKQSNVTFV